MNIIQGALSAPSGSKFTIVAARFNDLIIERLISGAVDTLQRHGVPDDHITLVRVPGAWEIPWACRKVAEKQAPSAIVSLGAVVRGSTPHFEYVCSEVAKGVNQVSLTTGVITTFGVLTTDTMNQALDRAGGKAGNKGVEAALAALEMVSLEAALNA